MPHTKTLRCQSVANEFVLSHMDESCRTRMNRQTRDCLARTRKCVRCQSVATGVNRRRHGGMRCCVLLQCVVAVY